MDLYRKWMKQLVNNNNINIKVIKERRTTKSEVIVYLPA